MFIFFERIFSDISYLIIKYYNKEVLRKVKKKINRFLSSFFVSALYSYAHYNLSQVGLYPIRSQKLYLMPTTQNPIHRYTTPFNSNFEDINPYFNSLNGKILFNYISNANYIFHVEKWTHICAFIFNYIVFQSKERLWNFFYKRITKPERVKIQS